MNMSLNQDLSKKDRQLGCKLNSTQYDRKKVRDENKSLKKIKVLQSIAKKKNCVIEEKEHLIDSVQLVNSKRQNRIL